MFVPSQKKSTVSLTPRYSITIGYFRKDVATRTTSSALSQQSKSFCLPSLATNLLRLLSRQKRTGRPAIIVNHKISLWSYYSHAWNDVKELDVFHGMMPPGGVVACYARKNFLFLSCVPNP